MSYSIKKMSYSIKKMNNKSRPMLIKLLLNYHRERTKKTPERTWFKHGTQACFDMYPIQFVNTHAGTHPRMHSRNHPLSNTQIQETGRGGWGWERNRNRETETKRETHRESEREREREARQRDRERQKDRERERQKEGETKRDREETEQYQSSFCHNAENLSLSWQYQHVKGSGVKSLDLVSDGRLLSISWEDGKVSR